MNVNTKRKNAKRNNNKKRNTNGQRCIEPPASIFFKNTFTMLPYCRNYSVIHLLWARGCVCVCECVWLSQARLAHAMGTVCCRVDGVRRAFVQMKISVAIAQLTNRWQFDAQIQKFVAFVQIHCKCNKSLAGATHPHTFKTTAVTGHGWMAMEWRRSCLRPEERKKVMLIAL